MSAYIQDRIREIRARPRTPSEIDELMLASRSRALGAEPIFINPTAVERVYETCSYIEWGITLAEVIKITGLSYETVRCAMARFKREGLLRVTADYKVGELGWKRTVYEWVNQGERDVDAS